MGNVYILLVKSHIGIIWCISNLPSYFSYHDDWLLYSIAKISTLGVIIGNHRLWTHRSFKAKLPVRILCMLCSSMCNEGSIYWWCRDHIMHHKYSDTDADPYNSNRGLLFSHMTWLFFDKHSALIEKSKEVDFPHLLSDPVVRFQNALDPYFRHFMCFGLQTLYGHYVYNDWKIGLFVLGFFRWFLHYNAHRRLIHWYIIQESVNVIRI